MRQRPNGGSAYIPVFILKSGTERLYGSGIADSPQRLGGGLTHLLILVPEGGTEWFDRTCIAD